MNFTSANKVTAGSEFNSTIGTNIHFAGGPEIKWSTNVTISYDLKDVYRYHSRGITSIGRNTAMKHQTYFYTTAGFDPKMDEETDKYLKSLDNSAYRYKISNYVLMAMSITYKLMNMFDSGSVLIPGTKGTWTEATREALQKGTSGVVFSLELIRSKIVALEGWMYKFGYWKNFVRNDFQPNALMQASSTKGVFLGAQFKNLADAAEHNEYTSSALQLDNTIRLSSRKASGIAPKDLFFPRDIQPQSAMKPQDWISPEKIITEIKSKLGKEPTEYSEFNGFKGEVNSNLELAPGRITSWSNEISSDATVHTTKAISQDSLDYQRAKLELDEITVKERRAKSQLQSILLNSDNAPQIQSLSPAELAMAPLAAAAKTANATQMVILQAEATKLHLSLELMKTLQSAKVKRLKAALRTPAAKRHSLIQNSPDFFEISHTEGEDVTMIRGNKSELTLRKKQDANSKNDVSLNITKEQVAISCTDTSALIVTKSSVGLVANTSGLLVSDDNLELLGGGGAISMKNNSVTIGDLKITNLTGKTNIEALSKANKKRKELESAYLAMTEKLQKELDKKSTEIDELKQAVAKLGKEK